MLIKWPVTQTESIYKGKYLNNLKEGFQEVYHSFITFNSCIKFHS